MEPMMMMAGLSALSGLAGGLAGGKKGGGGNTSNQNTLSNPINIVMPSTQTFGLALSNNPTIANIIGPGANISPAVGGASLPQSVAPYVNAPLDNNSSPSQTATDGSNPGGILPRSSPTGNLGLGGGFAQPRPMAMNNDLILIIMIAGGAFLLMQSQG